MQVNSEQVRIRQLSERERMLIKFLTLDERKAALLVAAEEKFRATAGAGKDSDDE